MAVVEEHGGQTRNRVVEVGDAELAAGLGSDEVGKDVVAHARRSISVDVNVVALSAKIRSSEGGDGTAQ